MSAYPFDTTSTLASNLIKNETHFAGESEYYGKWFIVPEFGPFYLNNFKITATTDGVVRELTIGVDYVFTFFYKAGSQSIGIPLFGGITLNKSSINKNDIINITYQTLGGDWVADRIYVINQLLATSYNPILTVLDLLTDKLSPFPDIKSPYVINPEYGAQGLVVAIRNLAVAISKQETLADIIAHLSDFNNPHMDTKATIGLPDMQNYPIALDSEVAALVPGEKYIVLSQLISAMMGISITLTAAPNLCGPKSVYGGTVSHYVITDFDSRLTYTVSVDHGTVTQVDDTLIYTAPDEVTVTATLVVNGAQFPVSVIPDAIKKPSIQNLANGSVIHTDTITPVGTEYQTLSGNTSGHLSTDWELATDVDFTNIVIQSTNDSVNLIQWAILGLTVDTPYYLRFRYNNAVTSSEWSDTIEFTYAVIVANKFSSLSQTIYPLDLNTKDYANGVEFGSQISISNDGRLLVVGAISKSVEVAGTIYDWVGQVYIYKLNNGVYELNQIINSKYPTSQHQQFGQFFSLSGDGTTLVINSGSLLLYGNSAEFIATYGSAAYYNELYVFKNQDINGTDQFSMTSTHTELNKGVNFGNIFINDDGTEVLNVPFMYQTLRDANSTSSGIYSHAGGFSYFTLSTDGKTITLVETQTPITLGLVTDVDEIGNFGVCSVASKDLSVLVVDDYYNDPAHRNDSVYTVRVFKRINGHYVLTDSVKVDVDPYYTGTVGDYTSNFGYTMSMNSLGTVLSVNSYYPYADVTNTSTPLVQPYYSLFFIDNDGKLNYNDRIGPVAPEFPNTGIDANGAYMAFNGPGNTIAFIHYELVNAADKPVYDTKVMIYESNFTADQMADGITVTKTNMPQYTLVSTTALGSLINCLTIGLNTVFSQDDRYLIVGDLNGSFDGTINTGRVFVLK